MTSAEALMVRVSGDCRSFLLGIILKPALEARKRKGGKEGALAVETAGLKLVRSTAKASFRSVSVTATLR